LCCGQPISTQQKLDCREEEYQKTWLYPHQGWMNFSEQPKNVASNLNQLLMPGIRTSRGKKLV